MNTYVIGDIHGCHGALIQCLERCNFDKEIDTLISLGDIVDGWHLVPECVSELMTIKNHIPVKGNHDWWFETWLETRVANPIHYDQGGKATIEAYLKAGEEIIREHHEKFFRRQVPYYVDESNRLFVHGGINWHKALDDQNRTDMMWDRHMYMVALQWEAFALTHPTHKKDYFKEFETIFVGHTATNIQKDFRYPETTEPVHVVNLYNLDTGAGFNGKLSLMNVNTKEVFQSDLVTDIYKEEFNQRLKNFEEDKKEWKKRRR